MEEESSLPLTKPTPPPPPRVVETNPFGDDDGDDTTEEPAQSTPKKPVKPKKPAPKQAPMSLNNPVDETDRGSISSAYFSDKMRGTETTVGTRLNPDPIYHKVTFSVPWLCFAIFAHVSQFSILLSVGYEALGVAAFVVCLLLTLTVIGFMLASRWFVTKSRLSDARNIKLKNNIITPDDEKDDVPNIAVYLLASAAVLEGILFAIYTVVTGGHNNNNDSGFYTENTMLQTLRFTSVTLLAFHRILRPANRLDPVRTILELEVMSVCWDALDGSTIYQLIGEDLDVSDSYYQALRVLMGFWYVSVGVRIGIMLVLNCSPDSRVYQQVLTAPLELDPQPTIDRTFQGLRLRAVVIVVMSFADLYAACIRIILWAKGQFEGNTIQQEMTLKNVLFFGTLYGAYSYYFNTIERYWNDREIIFCLKYPTRSLQLVLCRYGFVATYLTTGCLMSYVLIEAEGRAYKWTANIAVDVVLCAFFLLYCSEVHMKNMVYTPSNIFLPRHGYILFPGKFVLVVSILMWCSLYLARVPAIYYSYDSANDDDTSLSAYQNSLLVVVFSVIPLGLLSMYWSVSYMLFRSEFTACPGNYNGIHDPCIHMVSKAIMVDGALDVISAVAFMQLVENSLPAAMDGAVVMCTILELVNASQNMALPCLLSGGHLDRPKQLVKWKAYLKISQNIIDLLCLICRLVLWTRYKAVGSVFLIKNLFNLLHNSAQVERYKVVELYPTDTMFSEFVHPAEWYKMNKEEWREATSASIASQARAGRST